MERAVLDSLDPLIAGLMERGYTVAGPVVRDGVIRFAPISSAEDLPHGWADAQEPGRYRAHGAGNDLMFGYAASPDSAKSYTHPPRATLLRMRGESVEEVEPDARPVALLGIRPCDLAALAVQDRVFTHSAYRARREALFLVAVNCAVPGGTCFCASMGTGPKATGGFDLALTELTGPHRFLAQAGGPRGEELLSSLPHRPATAGDQDAADDISRVAAEHMGRRVELDGLRERLVEQRESPIWNEIGSRCLTCANCTMVCPTCFCTTVEDTVNLTDGTAERSERWDSCFALEFTELGGTPVRGSAGSRYRQWLTHKFSSWVEQFGGFGCVGCGRCVTWCPAGIDITEELERLR
ncbi:4Fe-4S dicluster domain-containing protein [Spongiactinospora sp. TRM90649]|uniref:4Fe-4S dicluster domain-containing protein n=1 Tax=Spongiactinospora sp. TRM90649 TaxID=3031114 RepID=UPI0023F94446|nr:4Fe-4S dicluster domain-containing protein [Spongiactinospora sp. TRM90649]MDF5755225.1 4Fe-4S dicluster domain-containing protein [Spongiactinospora sp. TRM90649]